MSSLVQQEQFDMTYRYYYAERQGRLDLAGLYQVYPRVNERWQYLYAYDLGYKAVHLFTKVKNDNENTLGLRHEASGRIETVYLTPEELILGIKVVDLSTMKNDIVKVPTDW